MIKKTKVETCKSSTKWCKNINITQAFKINERQFSFFSSSSRSDNAPFKMATFSFFSSIFPFKAFALLTKEISPSFSACSTHNTKQTLFLASMKESYLRFYIFILRQNDGFWSSTAYFSFLDFSASSARWCFGRADWCNLGIVGLRLLVSM